MNPYIEMAEDSLIHTYNRYPIVFDYGSDVYLYDTDGNKYLDFAAGIAVFALGYGNTKYNQALKDQVDKLIHTSNYYYSKPMAMAAAKLKKASQMKKVFFCNSGTEAIEGALKLAKKYASQKKGADCHEIIAMEHSFHGRSIGALSVTGTAKYREAFEPLMSGVKFATFNDIESVKEQISEKTCAIILEPIQGEGGIYPASNEFLHTLRKICDEKDIVLIFDEIQCGMGRCGAMFACQKYGIKPDVMTAAKALGCGIPVGAFMANEKMAAVLTPGDHGTTYGGNPLAGAAVSKVFDLFDELDLLNHVNEITPYLEEELSKLVMEYQEIKERRGIGLMQGLEFVVPVGDVIKTALEHGLVLISAGTHTIRFIPSLIINKGHIDEMILILKQAIEKNT